MRRARCNSGSKAVSSAWPTPDPKVGDTSSKRFVEMTVDRADRRLKNEMLDKASPSHRHGRTPAARLHATLLGQSLDRFSGPGTVSVAYANSKSRRTRSISAGCLPSRMLAAKTGMSRVAH
jgi:hypothetical protein